MPTLKDTRQVVEVKLEAVEGGLVKIYTSLLAGDMDALIAKTNNGQNMSLVAIISAVIKEWNLEGEDGKVLPITPENVGLLDSRDATKIVQAVDFKSDFLGQQTAQ